MKYSPRTYSLTTAICLMLGIASAFGFDWTGHFAWLVLGGCAAAVAISTYFVQHLQPKSVVDSTSARSLQSASLAYESLAKKAVSRLGPVPVASFAMYPESPSWKTKDREPADDWDIAGYHTVSEPPSPAELALRIARDLQSSGKREVRELVIGADLSVTLRFKDVDEQPESSQFSQPTDLVSPAYIQ